MASYDRRVLEPRPSNPLVRRPGRFALRRFVSLLLLSAALTAGGCKQELAQFSPPEESPSPAASQPTARESAYDETPPAPTPEAVDAVHAPPEAEAQPPPNPNGTDVVLTTSAGTILIALDPERAPKAAANILKHVDAGFYEGLVFHQVLADGLVQTGAYDADGARKKPLGGSVALETHPQALPQAGSVLLGRTLAPNTGTTQLLLLLADEPALHGDYTVVGEITGGLDVVKRISRLKTERRPRLPDWPVEPVTIVSAKRR